MSDVGPDQSGLASGIVNTAFMIGGSLGLAILASIAAARANGALADGLGQAQALTAGYSAASLTGAACAAAAALLAALRLRTSAPTTAAAPMAGH